LSYQSLTLIIPFLGSISKICNALLRYDPSFRSGEKVLGRIALQFAYQLSAVDTDTQCRDLYTYVKALPATTTCLQIESQHNFTGNPNLISANDADGYPCILKILRVRDGADPLCRRMLEVEREQRACKILNLGYPVAGYSLCLVEMISVSQGEISFKALKMPRYCLPLSQSARYLSHFLVREGRKLVSTIEYIHSKELVHMDIKSSNIFVDNRGQWHLGDFGSSCSFGEIITSSTIQFCKENVIGLTGDPKYDWFMLLVTLVIETLNDKHRFRHHLYDGGNQFVSVSKLLTMVNDIADEVLRDLLFAIIEKMKAYFL
jgi:serine/threonine protein kinase